jgi:amidase
VKLVAETLDTVGVLARTVADTALFVGALTRRTDLLELKEIDGAPRIGLCRTHDWDAVAPDMAEALETAGAMLAAARARVSEISLPETFAQLGEAHATIQGFEAARRFAPELDAQHAALSMPLAAMLDEGRRVRPERYEAAVSLASACRARLADTMGSCDVLLAPSATGEAPEGLASTGSPVMNRVWTLLHAPCVSVPAGRGARRLPLGLQVIGRLGDDARTLATAEWLGARLES